MNTLRTQSFSSQRQSGEFSRFESPAQQGEDPVYPARGVCLITRSLCRNALSGDDRDGRAATSARGRLARWHYVPDGTGLLPADAPPFAGGIIINSLVAYSMVAGRNRIAPGRQAEKDGGRADVEKWRRYLASAALLKDIFFHYLLLGNTEIGCAKNWQGHDISRLIRSGTIMP